MYAHHNAKLLYLAHPKVASNATHRALTQQAGFEPSPDHHGRLDGPNAHLLPRIDENWTIFCTVRNHFDALVSWRYGRDIPGDRWSVDYWDVLMEYLEPWVKPGVMWFHADDCDRVLRYERLEDDLNDLLTEHGFGPIDLEEWNVTRKRPDGDYRDYFDDDLRAKVEEAFGEEMARFGYEW